MRIVSRQSPKGFTLLELLIALGIMALVLAILYKTFSSTTDVISHIEDETQIYRMAHLGLSIMGEELRSTFWSQDRLLTGFVGSSDSLEFTALSRHRYGEGVQGPELARINYYLQLLPVDPGEKPNTVLVHDEETNVLSVSSKSRQITELSENVGSLTFRYLGKEDWESDWDTEEDHDVPRAVEIQLILLDDRDREYVFYTRIDIPISKLG